MAGSLGVQGADVDAPRARDNRRTGSQQGGTRHPRCAADHDHIAKAALVLRMQACRLRRHGRIGSAEFGAQRHLRHGAGHAQIVEPDLARMVAALGGEQAGLQGQQ